MMILFISKNKPPRSENKSLYFTCIECFLMLFQFFVNQSHKGFSQFVKSCKFPLVKKFKRRNEIAYNS